MSIFTARAGRAGTGPPLATGVPVRGHVATAAGAAVVLVVVGAVVGPVAEWVGEAGDEHAASTRPADAASSPLPTIIPRLRRGARGVVCVGGICMFELAIVGDALVPGGHAAFVGTADPFCAETPE